MGSFTVISSTYEYVNTDLTIMEAKPGRCMYFDIINMEVPRKTFFRCLKGPKHRKMLQTLIKVMYLRYTRIYPSVYWS